MAEIELSVLSRQCLAGCFPNKRILESEVSAWEAERNASVVKVYWRYKTADARIKLKSLYPKIELWQTTTITQTRFRSNHLRCNPCLVGFLEVVLSPQKGAGTAGFSLISIGMNAARALEGTAAGHFSM